MAVLLKHFPPRGIHGWETFTPFKKSLPGTKVFERNGKPAKLEIVYRQTVLQEARSEISRSSRP